MDVELLFSRTPFAQQTGGQFAFTRPATSQVVQLPAGKDKVAIPLPDDLQKKNMLVEVTAAGKTRIATYFATDMDVKFTENFGLLKVADTVNGKPLTKVYVKVYAKLADGSVKFHKDGYTDLRGRFRLCLGEHAGTPGDPALRGADPLATTTAPSSRKPPRRNSENGRRRLRGERNRRLLSRRAADPESNYLLGAVASPSPRGSAYLPEILGQGPSGGRIEQGSICCLLNEEVPLLASDCDDGYNSNHFPDLAFPTDDSFPLHRDACVQCHQLRASGHRFRSGSIVSRLGTAAL